MAIRREDSGKISTIVGTQQEKGEIQGVWGGGRDEEGSRNFGKG